MKKENMLKVSYELNEYGVSGQAENIGENQAGDVLRTCRRGYFKNAFKLSAVSSGDDVCADSHFVCSLSDLSPIFSESCEVRPGGLLSAGGDGQRQSRGNLSRAVRFYGLLSLILYWGLQQDYGIHGRKKKKTEGIRLVKKKELPESAPAYQKTMFEALFRDGAEEVYTQKLPEGFGKYLRKALKELEKEFNGEKDLGLRKFLDWIAMILVSVSFGIFIGGSSAVSLSDHMVFGVFGGIVIHGLEELAEGQRRRGLFRRGSRRFSSVGDLPVSDVLYSGGCLVLHRRDCLISDLYMYGGFAFGAAAALFGGSLFHFSAYRNVSRSFPVSENLSGKVIKVHWSASSFQIPTTIIGYSYAVALGLTARWEKNFRPIRNTQPFWYKVDEDDPFSARYMDRWISEDFYPRCQIDNKSAVAEKIDSFTSGSSDSSGASSDSAGGGGGVGSW